VELGGRWLTSPRICALECQKVSRPSSLSKLKILSVQSPSSGLAMSHSTSSTCIIKGSAGLMLAFPLQNLHYLSS
jgi:hypothetical protein